VTAGDVTATAKGPRCRATADILPCRAERITHDVVGGSCAAPDTPR
jgi:hypothetical protein